MNTLQLISAIRLATGKPVDQVAKQHGYSKHTFYRVIKGESQTTRVQNIIAAIVGKKPADIWPDTQLTEAKK